MDIKPSGIRKIIDASDVGSVANEQILKYNSTTKKFDGHTLALSDVLIAGSGLLASGNTLSMSHLGLESLSDPGGDRILFWDETANAFKWLSVGSNLTITDTTIAASGGGGSSAAADDITAGDAAVTISTTVGAVNITPASGSAIVLDGTINVDAGVVTGATSITSTAFVGALTGNAATATALASGRTIGMTGDVVWTSASFTGTGNVTGAATIQANSVDGTMIAIGSDAQGDIMYYTGSDWARLGAGTNGHYLKTQGGSANPTWASVGGGTATAVTVADESTDTTCFPLFVTAATGDLGPKSGSNLAFNSSSGVLTATGFAGPITGNVTGNTSGTAATVTGAAQTNVTSLGTLTALTVDDVAVDGKVITMTGSSSDTAVFTAGANGALSIVTTDAAAAAANIQITADGTVDIDSAGVLTLDSGAAINIEPATGSAILLDGTISIDAGVVTGATSITSTAFVGALTGNSSTTTKLVTARAIAVAGDVTGTANFDGSAAISITTTIAANAVDGTMIALGSDTTGDIMYYNGTNYIRLAAAQDGYVLTAAGAGVAPAWEAAASSGDITAVVAGTGLSGGATSGSATLNVDAAQSGITSLGTLTALTVDDVAVDGKVITMTGSSSDTAVITVGTNGALSIVTTDAAATAANIQITADGTVDIDSAGVLTLDSGAAINIEPAVGSAILLDGTISIDAGIVTGATSITSTAFVGALTGNVTGNASGTALTVTQAAQTNITSLGTLTALTVDDVAVDGKVITMTGSSSDTAVITAGTNGTLSIVTTDAAAAAANIQITADGTAELAGTTVTLDSSSGITLDADGGTITFADAGVSLGTITSSGYSGTAATATALASGRTIGMTGDVVWTSASFTGAGNVTGSATIQANSVDGTMVALGSDAQGDIMYYNGTDYVRLGAGTNGHFLKTQGGSANPAWASVGGGTATAVTIADESSDTTCFPLFVTAATGDLGPKSGTNLTFNSSTGVLAATGFSGPLTGNVTGNTSGTAATVTGAAQTNITSLGALTALTVDDVVVDGKVITMTGSSSDTAVFTAGANGALSIVTTDAAATAANIQITADGTVDIDSAGVLTLDSGAAINIEPAVGSAILLDGTISVDAGVVTGATSITSTAFVGALTGTASIASAVVVVDESSDTTCFPLFASGATSGQSVKSGSNLTFNASSGLLTATLLAGDLTGAVTGNADTATALAAGRTIGMTGDVVWTSASFTGAGNVTGSATIQANSVDGTMIALGSDAAGDIMYNNGTDYIRLAKGDDDEVLTLASGVPSWAAIGGGGDITAVVAGTGLSGGATAGSATLNVDAAQSGVTSLGTLTALTVDDVAVDGKVITMTGSSSDTVVFTAGTNGTLSIVTTDAAATAANIQITADGTVDIDSAGVLTLDSGAAINIEPASGSAILLDGTISIDAGVVTGATSITSTAFVGALTGNVTGNASGTAATVTGAAQTNITSLGTLTALTVDDVAINGKVITMTGDTSDTVVFTAGTHGTLSIVTTDDAAAAANIQITADGTVDIDSAGVLTLDSGAAINIEPAVGSAILLDGTISIDAGVVTGATSITSTAFVGALTGNASGTAATVTGAAQTNITSLGTLTALTVDDIAMNAKVMTMTGSTDDTAVFTVGTNGTLSIVTTDAAATAANIQITADGTVDIDSAGVLTLDSGAAINIEPASGSAILLDGTISIDAGVVTGATSITSTAFVGALTGNVTGNTSGTAATVTGAAQGNITSLGTLTTLTVDDVVVDGKVITMTGSSGDTAVITAGTNGTLSIVTTDAAATAANIQITADGTVDIDSAGVLTLDSGAAINIEPASGSAILLDGTISIDAGVVTGATSITSTAFVGALTGNVTGNASGTAATVTGAAQSNITSLGTLTALTVDDVAVDGKVITMTGSSSDTAVITAGTNGTLSIVTTDAAATAANIQITADGTVDIDSAGVLTLDSGAAINIEPAAGSAILLDGTISIDAGVVTGATSITSTTFVGALTGNSSTATKLATARAIAVAGDVTGTANFDGSAAISITTTLASASVDFAHVQNVAANSILGRNANSSGVLSEIALTTTQILIGDGTGFTAAALSGDVTMTNAGVVSLAANSVDSDQYVDGSIDNAHIADDAIDSEHYAAGSIDTAHIADAQVTLAKIANQAANTVLVRDANSSGVVSAKALTTTQILIGDGTGFTAAALSGDATMTNAGVVSIADDVISSAELADACAAVTSFTAPLIEGSTSVQTPLIEYTDGDDAIAIADGGLCTFPQLTTFSKATKPALKANTDGTTVTFDVNEANMHTVTLGGNRAFAISNETAGQRFIIRILQDGTGSRTVTWFSTIKWAGGSAPTLTTTASKADVVGFIVTGADTYDGFVVGQNI